MDSNRPKENQQQFQTAMKAVGQAIQLDSRGNSRDAYLHYLSCMQYISQCLLQDARIKVSQPSVNLKTQTTVKMVKMAQQCSERATDLLDNMEEESTPAANLSLPPVHLSASPSSSPTPQSSLSSSTSWSLSSSTLMPSSSSLSSSVPAGRISPSMFPPVPSTFSHAAPTHVAVVRPTVQHPGTQNLPVPSALPAYQRDEPPGPLEKAYRENKKLMAAYRSRLNRMQTGKNKAMVNLTFQRRLMENMAIAKAREASLAKKIKERQQRLQEQAAQRFSSSGQPTKEEMELRTVYASILEYENMKTWIQDWRQRLQDSPGDLKLIHSLITEILSRDEHPLTQLLKQYQISIYHKIMPLIQRELPSIEEIVVPYGDVVPLQLQEPRAVPEGGFTTPDELDQSMDEMLAKRLHALRENSSSSVDSEASNARQVSQTDSMMFTPSEMSDDMLEELLSEDDAPSASMEDTGGIREGDATPAASKCLKGTDEDAKDVEENGHLNDSGIQNGDEASSSDDANGGNESQREEASDVVDRMTEIVNEVRGEVEKAIEDGDKLCQELEKGDSVCHNSDDVDVNDDREVAKTTNDSVNDSHEEERDERTMSDMGTKEEEGTNGADGASEGGVSGQEEGCHERNDASNYGEDGNTQNDQTYQENGKGESSSDDGQESEKDVEQNNDNSIPTSSEGAAKREEENEGGNEENGADRIAEMRTEALKRHLKSISKDVLMFTERLQSLLVAVYEQLNSTAAKEQCIAVIEAFFFKDIWKPLLMLFRRFNYKKEKCAAVAMTMYQHAMPQHIGVQEKFCLLREGPVQDDHQASSSSSPYQQAVDELCKLQGYTCPLQKLECIVRVSRIVIECVEDFYESQGKPRQSPENSVGCDDLLPILSYVIMKSSLPQIVSECSAMEEFIHEGYLFGEEGYCLTTCQTALSYVLKLGSDGDPPS